MKTILIKSPNSLEKIILSFPFFHLLDRQLDNPYLKIITYPEHSEIWELLQILKQVLLLSEEEDKILGAYPFAYQNMDKIDYYFDLEGSISGALLGKAFKSPIRVGPNTGLFRSFLYSQTVEIMPHLSHSRNSMRFAETCLGLDFTNFRFSLSENELEILSGIGGGGINRDYILVIFQQITGVEGISKFWDELLSTISNKILVVGCLDPYSSLDGFLATHTSDNEIIHLKGENICFMAKNLIKAKGLITDNFLMSYIASYFGKESVVFTDNIYSVSRLDSFKRWPSIIYLKNNKPKKVFTYETNSEIFGMEEVSSYISKHFKYKTR